MLTEFKKNYQPSDNLHKLSLFNKNSLPTEIKEPLESKNNVEHKET